MTKINAHIDRRTVRERERERERERKRHQQRNIDKDGDKERQRDRVRQKVNDKWVEFKFQSRQFILLYTNALEKGMKPLFFLSHRRVNCWPDWALSYWSVYKKKMTRNLISSCVGVGRPTMSSNSPREENSWSATSSPFRDIFSLETVRKEKI